MTKTEKGHGNAIYVGLTESGT